MILYFDVSKFQFQRYDVLNLLKCRTGVTYASSAHIDDSDGNLTIGALRSSYKYRSMDYALDRYHHEVREVRLCFCFYFLHLSC